MEMFTTCDNTNRSYGTPEPISSRVGGTSRCRRGSVERLITSRSISLLSVAVPQAYEPKRISLSGLFASTILAVNSAISL